MRRIVFRALIVSLCAVSAALAFLGPLDGLAERLGSQALIARNTEHLDNSFGKALAGFGVMSALKAGLDIIEGSEVGASFGVTAQLEVGDIVQPAYDYVDIAWRTLLTGCIALVAIRYLQQAATLVDGYLLGTALALSAFVMLLRWWFPRWTGAREVARDALSLVIVATLAFYYAIPLSVWGASRLSSAITQPAIEEAQRGFRGARDALFPDSSDVTDGFLSRLQDLQDRVQQIATYLKYKTTDILVWTIKLIAAYLFDCIVFPVALFVLMLVLLRATMRYLLHRQLGRSLRADLTQYLTDRRDRELGSPEE